jgi:hypothetical protein
MEETIYKVERQHQEHAQLLAMLYLAFGGFGAGCLALMLCFLLAL